MATILSLLLLVQTMQSAESLRFAQVAEQGYDTSCGLSVLAELLTRYWNYPISEEALLAEWSVLRQMSGQPQNPTSTRNQENYSVSFKDMQDLLSHNGFSSKAFRFTYEQLVKASGSYAPLILHFADQEGHFVLCLYAEDDFLVIADPAEGVYWLSREDRLPRWQGYALLVQKTGQKKEKGTLDRIVQEAQEKRETLQKLSLIRCGGR